MTKTTTRKVRPRRGIKRRPQMCSDMTKILQGYERLIANPAEERQAYHHQWLRVGCRLCFSAGARPFLGVGPACDVCILYQTGDADLDDRGQCVTQKLKRVIDAVVYGEASDEEIRQAAVARHEELLQILSKNGYDYK